MGYLMVLRSQWEFNERFVEKFGSSRIKNKLSLNGKLIESGMGVRGWCTFLTKKGNNYTRLFIIMTIIIFIVSKKKKTSTSPSTI